MATLRSGPVRLVGSAVLTALFLVGGTAAPALAAHAQRGRWEVILGHFKTMREAQAAQAHAESRGYKAVIQAIGPGNVEVEIANGLASRADATTFCSRARSHGIHCSVEEEFHGYPSGWGR